MSNKSAKLILIIAVLLIIEGVSGLSFTQPGPNYTVWLKDPAGDVESGRIDITKFAAYPSNGKLNIIITLNESVPKGPKVPSGKAIWYNVALDVDSTTGKKEHGLRMDYWVYIGWQGYSNRPIEGLGRYKNGARNPDYKRLTKFEVKDNFVAVQLPTSYIENPFNIRCYAHSFDNTKSTTYTDSTPGVLLIRRKVVSKK